MVLLLILEHYIFNLNIKKLEGKIAVLQSFKFNPNFEEKDLRSINEKDIINIRSEFDTFKIDKFRISIQNPNYRIEELKDEFYTYLATVLIELDPLDD